MTISSKLKEGVWNVGIIKSDISDILEGKPYTIEWMKHSYKDRFFADPFLLKEDKDFYYILAEEYKFFDRKGRIVLLSVRKSGVRLIKKELILDEKYHLSYPIPYNGSIHPECFRSGVLSSYDISNRGIAKKQLDLDYPLIDPTFLEYNGIEWLFGTSAVDNFNAQRDLFIFYKENKTYKSVSLTPVKSDVQTSRPGGLFFKHGGKLYRPAQNCEHFYGESIKIMKVLELSKEGYKEEEIMEIKDPSGINDGIHTFNVYNGFVVVDGFKERTLLMKILYIKFKKIYSWFFDKDNREKAYKIEE